MAKDKKKLSYLGLLRVEEKLKERGWKKSSHEICFGTLKFGESREGETYAIGCNYKNWQKFYDREPIKTKGFNLFCQVLDLVPDKVAHNPKTDLGQAPDLGTFYGREEDLTELKQSILQDRCRLISIVGFAGIGKTKLALQLAREVEEEFEYLIWRKLYYTPPLESLLKELIESVSDSEETELATTTEGLTEQLLRYLKERRCLLIFDNIESIGHGDRADSYRKEYEDFFDCIGTSQHSSCVLLTSRVKFSSLEEMEGIDAVRSRPLKGLDTEAGRKICQDIVQKSNCEIDGTEEDWQHLISAYEGNPLALEIVARHILRIRRGDLAKFLEEDLKVLKSIEQLFNWHFEHLTSDEQTIMYWLALNQEGISMDKLKEYLVFDRQKRLLAQTLDSLEKKIPIERSGDRWSLHFLLMEYMTERIIKKVCEEITSGRLELFNSHALIQASAKDYIKQEQIDSRLQPIRDRLIESFGSESQNSLENRLAPPQLLKNFNRTFPGYTAANLINLMSCAGIPITGYDFSGMTIWEADLNTNLHDVNFAGCRFARCSFIKSFGCVMAIAFHPRKELIAVADDVGLIQLLYFDGQTELILGSRDGEITTDLAFSPDGRWLASSSYASGIGPSYDSQDSTVKIWATNTGDLYQTFIAEGHQLFSVAFSPDGQTVASGGNDTNRDESGTINLNLWHIHENRYRTLQQKYTRSNRNSNITSLIFHPRENLLACTYNDTVCMWDTATEELLYTLDDFRGWGRTFDFHPTNKILVGGCSDGTIEVLKAETGEVLKAWQGHTEGVFFVSFSSDGQRIISVGEDGTIKVWDVETEECLKTSWVDVRDDDIIQFMSQENLLAIYPGYPSWLALWNVDTEDYLKIWQSPSNIDIYIAISPDGGTVASRGLDDVNGNNTIRVWVDGKSISTWRLGLGYIYFSPDAHTLISSEDDCIKWREVKSGKLKQTFKHPLVKEISWFRQSADGRFIAGYNRLLKSVIVLDVETGENWSIKAKLGADIAFSCNGQYLALSERNPFGSNNTTKSIIKIYNVNTGESHRNLVFSYHKYIRKVVFHPNDRLLIGWEGKLTIFWDLETGESKSIQTFENYNENYIHTSMVHDLFFDEEGNTFIVSSINSTIEIWRIDTAEIWSANTAARRIKVLQGGHSSPIRGVKATADGQNLVSCDRDGVILLWDVTQRSFKLIHSERPYEGMNIADVKGLTDAQIATLIALGAVEI